MASFKSTVIVFLTLGVLAAGGVGAGYLYVQHQAQAVDQDLALAEQFLAQGQAQKADQLLATRLAAAAPQAAWLPRAYALRLEALQRLDDREALRALATRLVDPAQALVPPGDPAWARAQAVLGQAAIEAQRNGEARQRFETLLAQPAGTVGQTSASLGLARLEMAEGRIPVARDRLAALLAILSEDEGARSKVEFNLGQCNMLLLKHPPQTGLGSDYEVHVIQARDTLDALGRQFDVSPELMIYINDIRDPRRLTVGGRLIIPKLDLTIVVNKSDNTLTLRNHDRFFKKYRVRTGEFDYMTPSGDFAIVNKKPDPPWNNPKDGRTYPPGDPGNQLGSRWMGFQGSNLGIHEAIDPASIGSYSSNGCVGMVKEDVQELFDLVPIGTPVRIIGTITQPHLTPLKDVR